MTLAGDAFRAYEATVGTLGGKLDAIDANTDPLAANTDTIETKLQAINDRQATPSPKFGQASVTAIGSGGADVQFASTPLVNGMVVTNTHTVADLYITHVSTGLGAADPTTRIVKPGTSTGHIPCTNADQVYMRCSSGTVVACFDGG